MAAVLAIAALGLALLDPHRPAAGVLVLDRAQEAVFTSADGVELWRAENVALSQNWSTDAALAVRTARDAVTGRYLLRFDAPGLAPPSSLMIARVSQSVQVEINGVTVHTDHDEDALERWDWYSPVVADIPDGLLAAADNIMVLTVVAGPGSVAGLSRVFVGGEEAISELGDRLHFLQKPLSTYANLSVVVMSVPLLLIWLHGRRVAGSPFRVYGLLAAASILFALRSMHVHAGAPPIPHHLWLALVGASLGWALGFFFSFLLHFVGAGSARTDRALVLFVAAGTLLMLLGPRARMAEVLTLLWYVPLAAVGCVCTAVVCLKTLRSPDRGRVGLSVALIVLLVAGIHDVLWTRGVLPFESLLWMPIVMPAVLLAISAAVANRFVQAWVRADALNRDLARRVREAEEEIRASYERRLDAERRETLASERAKLVEDLHDGVGSRLSVLLAALQASSLPRGRIVAALRDCLDDLKMIITARDRPTLGDALAALGGQLGGLLEPGGVELHVEIEPRADALRLGPRETLNLLRFVQEACANAARHGRGSWIRLECGFPSPGVLRIAVSDGGAQRKAAGLAPASSGRGIETMKARAARLGAELAIRRRADGWRITLDMPARPPPDRGGAREMPQDGAGPRKQDPRPAGELAVERTMR